MRSLSVAALLILMTFSSFVARADESAQREAIQEAVASAFNNGRFGELDAMANQFREGERTESGLWKLSIFYGGFWPKSLDPNYNGASFDRFEAQAMAWMGAQPKSIAAKLAYALILSHHAWFLRGGGYYYELTDEQRAGYTKYHIKARDHLVATKDEASADPNWYTQMVYVAMEEAWPDDAFDRLLAEAVAREPYYYQTYFAAIDRNLPKWGGSPAKINALIARAAGYTRERDGDSFIARALWFVAGRGKDIERSLKANWPDVDRGFQDLVRRYPEQTNFNAYARFACLAKDRTEFLAAYGQIKGQLVQEVWGNSGQGVVCAVWAMHPERNIEIE
ncbi:hypothetical protein LHFGNBLO_004851 [Mesorhizobium sp. AR10]|uniref:hypothetical protein n=1 Tax=Mesorhizobium sp. AR10 TaxID=2865839 RepID=UPI00215FFB36|nr:hypothetical protein [Mesorhizobium sp. AR10]UVK37765.1 hypothetical protein LHFGNBLO_004851 [Mesorhizobium sp. AR10]